MFRQTVLRAPVGAIGLLLTTLFVAACGAFAQPAPSAVQPIPLPPEDLSWPGDESNQVQLDIVNELPTDICYLYISPPADITWGGDWLDETETIPPGASRSAFVPAGTYDLMVEDCDHEPVGEVRDFDLTAANRHTFSATGSLPGSPTGVTIHLGEDCPPPPVTPQDEVIVRIGWVTTTVELAQDNARYMDFVAWVDGELVRDMVPVPLPAGLYTPSEDFGCGSVEPAPSAYWDLPIGQLTDGSHTIEVEFFTDAEIYDGYNTYPAGSLGIIDGTVQVGSGDGNVPLTLVNDTATTVCYVWIGPPASEWIDDVLGEHILEAGQELTVSVEPNDWALQAEDCSGNVLGYEASFDLSKPAVWHITGA